MDLSLYHISFSQILTFVSVAESGGFLKASLKMNLTQSAVSKSVAKLEKDLELKLFYRSTRRLELTPEGELLFEAWKPLVISMQTAYRHILNTRDRQDKLLNIGLVSTVIPEKYLPPLQEKFRQIHPEIQIRISIDSMPRLEELLIEGKLDAAFLPDFEHYTVEETALSWIWCQKKPARLLLSSDNPLSKNRTVEMKDILKEKFAALSDSRDNYIRDLKDRFRKYGAEPQIVLPFNSAYEIRHLFHPKDEVLFVDQFFDNINYKDSSQVIVTDEWNGLICAFKESRTPHVNAFLDLVREMAVQEE